MESYYPGEQAFLKTEKQLGRIRMLAHQYQATENMLPNELYGQPVTVLGPNMTPRDYYTVCLDNGIKVVCPERFLCKALIYPKEPLLSLDLPLD